MTSYAVAPATCVCFSPILATLIAERAALEGSWVVAECGGVPAFTQGIPEGNPLTTDRSARSCGSFEPPHAYPQPSTAGSASRQVVGRNVEASRPGDWL